jgi:DNA recombination protein RmuC
VENVLIIVIAAAVAAVIIAWLYRPRATGVSNESIEILQRQLQGLTETVNTQISNANDQMFRTLSTQFSESQKLVTGVRDAVNGQLNEIAKRVGETQQATAQVFTVAEQLKNLEKVLTSQKQRGNLGEAGLALVLGNALPPSTYKMQHQFTNGDRVDAVITMPDGKLIPIDAKFPMENYVRTIDETDPEIRTDYENLFKTDLKNRIDETAKYVRPGENTLDFAFMFIPAEGIYYDLTVGEIGTIRVNTRNLIEYAREKKVIIVSPTTFAAYLQTVLMGFKAFNIEKGAREIAKNIAALGRHLNAYQEYFTKLGNSLGTTVNHFNNAAGEFRKIDRDVLRITGTSPELSIELVERPNGDDTRALPAPMGK